MDLGLHEPSLRSLKALLILDHDGERILGKYYDTSFPTLRDQRKFEKRLFSKTVKANSEIILLDGITILYKSNIDLFFYVVGRINENELVLLSVLNCLFESINSVLKKNLDRKTVMECLHLVLMIFDEICEEGVIMEDDVDTVVKRVGQRTDDLSLSDQTVAHVQAKLEAKYASTAAVLQTAKDQFKWSILK
ncbi:coatomer subunit zeta-1 [Eurytemora carolleeae]|uniref:coatomer subunit zeta-1 n=1 Tax=Eurytemora carolleeae TaxID=1294199 RepID=UPI000C760B9A|nr:coatomer subunit zeta-1 [Eurytemora carolleeae]|eukprot:XP_023320807.1 coatomer subunit zeta-1-like [Eurytemora affinis]